MERNWSEIIWKWTKRILPIVVGAITGYAYYNYIGCNGSCPIAGNPFISTTYGAVMGALFVDWKGIFKRFFKREEKEIK